MRRRVSCSIVLNYVSEIESTRGNDSQVTPDKLPGGQDSEYSLWDSDSVYRVKLDHRSETLDMRTQKLDLRDNVS